MQERFGNKMHATVCCGKTVDNCINWNYFTTNFHQPAARLHIDCAIIDPPKYNLANIDVTI